MVLSNLSFSALPLRTSGLSLLKQPIKSQKSPTQPDTQSRLTTSLYFGKNDVFHRGDLISKTLDDVPLFFPQKFNDLVDKVGREKNSNYQGTQAERKEVNRFNFTIGAPTDEPPAYYLNQKTRYMNELGNHLYSPTEGLPEFRKAIATYLNTRYGISKDLINPETLQNKTAKLGVLPLQGSNQGLVFLLQSVLSHQLSDKTDKNIVLVPGLSYPTFKNGALMGGFNVEQVPSLPGTTIPDFVGYLSKEENRHKIPNIRAIVFSFPDNPTGAYVGRTYLKRLVDFAREHKIVLVSDMAYGELANPNAKTIAQKPLSIFQIPGAKDVAVEFHSLSKTFNLTGDRVAFAVGEPTLIEGLTKYKGVLDASNIPRYVQLAAADLLSSDQVPESHIEDMKKQYAARKSTMVKTLAGLGWISAEQAAEMISEKAKKTPFYVWLKVPSGYKHDPAKEIPRDWQFAEDLLKKTGMGVIPGSEFGPEGIGFVRIAMTQPAGIIDDSERELSESEFAYQKH